MIVLVSEKTPELYINYLKERNYDFIRAGAGRVDVRQALEFANELYGFKLVVSDSGGILNSILLEQGLVEEISLVFTISEEGCLPFQWREEFVNSLNILFAMCYLDVFKFQYNIRLSGTNP
ncbi:5-amino-6-(5-phosphoribosylamino)uracil reductase [Methanosarcina lacustris Z-7289]|uniref:5-amino-6-(5-phosphoribosylamino)uracil reductase n=1 Tax=Methanosarcina lacustris Z-7289 TaxID=1434111 RepID=A0A0E3S563_9EURY|nr:hypothetical protein [Methanosarcina lacustris]AKB76239.1 5-amino-6-(5-phosphoribosylamino)uracil reductase [Methanosarcina lacustris Z-7289]